MSTGPGGLLKHLHGVFLYPDTWSEHPKYRSRGEKSKVYVTHSIPRGAPWEEEGWTLCERPRGEQSKTVILARLTGCTAWPTASQPWVLDSGYTNDDDALAVHTIHFQEYKRLCDERAHAWTPGEQEKFQDELAALDASVGEVQRNQRFLAQRVTDLSEAVKGTQEATEELRTTLGRRIGDVEDELRKLGERDAPTRTGKACSCFSASSLQKFHHRHDKLSAGDLIAVVDVGGQLSDAHVVTHSKGKRRVEVEVGSSKRGGVKRDVNERDVFLYKPCAQCRRGSTKKLRRTR